jgi:hypothetical protein
MFYWLANFNFGITIKGKFYPIWWIRKLQCNIFGHCWFTYIRDVRWCAWCGRVAGKYPKMRVRKPENNETILLEKTRRKQLEENGVTQIKYDPRD